MDSKQISKFISLILRHKPEVIGITLDEHGWADVNKLVAGVRKVYPNFGKAQLYLIVENDEKQRYSFGHHGTKIRANQGHSIPVDVELKAVAPPRILYHGTAKKYIDSIMKDGLVPRSRLYVHLSLDIETAYNVGLRHGKKESEVEILRIMASDMYEDGYEFFLSENGVWLTKEVPVKYLRGVYWKE